jgi:hydrogenase expression/formation protein HypC
VPGDTRKNSFDRWTGLIKDVNLCMLPETKIDDYVLVHVGVAISIVDEEEAKLTFNYLNQMGEVEGELNE